MTYQPSLGRLASLKAKARKSLFTIMRNHPESFWKGDFAKRQSDWRGQRYPRQHFGGTWQEGPLAGTSCQAFYIDSFDQLGLRMVGTAHDISRRECLRTFPEGYYVRHDDYSDTMTGYVLQLPARKGQPQYIVGLAQSDCDGVTLHPLDRYSEPLEAARAADQLAEREAEKLREYDEAWQAGAEFARLGEEVEEARKEALAILGERRKANASPASLPALCGAIRAQVIALLGSIEEARAKRKELKEASRWQSEAFADGAGA